MKWACQVALALLVTAATWLPIVDDGIALLAPHRDSEA